MSVSKTILDETFSLGGNFGGDEIGAKTEYFGGDVQVAQTQSREFAKRLLLARRLNAAQFRPSLPAPCRTPSPTYPVSWPRRLSTRTRKSSHRDFGE